MTPEVILASLIWSMVHMDAIDIRHRLDRLMVVSRALYIAAHPDDENTQLLAYLTHAEAARTAYLSITRGDGGQNLIGSEQSPLMGVIRTHELLEARRIDGAEQLFTRAKDFGYSKRSDEALEAWGHEATLGDVVWAVRRFRPHVMITRFPEQGSTHGHHLASATLAREAFEAAADPKRFVEQLDRVEPWRAHRLVYNVPNRFMPEEARPDDLVVDIGGYDPASGLSHGEIAAASRSMHKSQGFGAARRFGPEPERFRHLAGDEATEGLFDGVARDWASVEGGASVGRALAAAREAFRADDPATIIDDLVRALRALEDVQDAGLRGWAQREIATLLIGSSGLLLEARAPTAAVVAGDELMVTVTALLRNDIPVTVEGLALDDRELLDDGAKPLAVNEPMVIEGTLDVAAKAPASVLPWLQHPPLLGRYDGGGDPDEPLPAPPLRARLRLTVAGAPLEVEVPVRHFDVDRVEGERHTDVEVVPAITATPEAKAILLACPEGGVAGAATRCEGRLRVAIVARRPGRIEVDAPEGYRVSPDVLEVDGDREVELAIAADVGVEPGTLRIVSIVDGERQSFAERALAHTHLPRRTVLLPAEVALTTALVDPPDVVVGHVAGPGDEVADGLRRVGMTVEDLDDEALVHGDLSRFGALLVGVRAFNTREALRRNVERLFDFAQAGGTVVVQYTTKSRREDFDIPLLPAPMKLGRGRVTDERAPVNVLQPDHPLLTTPHAIGEDDWRGWVQERGLYFGESWGDEVVALLEMADEGEAPEQGALLVAEHGEGRVVYVGLSLFRQFPAAVPGATRLMLNLLTPRRLPATTTADAPPPVMGSWRTFYAVVVLLLVVLIGSFYLLTRRYGT